MTPRQLRAQRKARLVRSADKLERTTREALAARDAALIEAHGAKSQGGLSYDEMARATGLSKGRVIQIVQGKSEYSKALKGGRDG